MVERVHKTSDNLHSYPQEIKNHFEPQKAGSIINSLSTAIPRPIVDLSLIHI